VTSSGLTSAFNAAASRGNESEPRNYEPRLRLFSAAGINDTAMVQKILMDNPDAATWRNAQGLTGLMAAAQAGAKEAAWILARAPNADLEAVNVNGSTALMFAAFEGKAAVADVLLKAGADINHVNAKGHTALMSAAAHGYRNTVALLLDSGADPTIKDAEGVTAVEFARDNEHAGVADLIAQAAAVYVPKPKAETAFKNAGAGMTAANANKPPLTQAERDAQNRTAIQQLEQKLIKAGLVG
jgi:ankyrin repeat protein